ncbi:GIP, partial [Symbiodinium sp. CCMP2456]
MASDAAADPWSAPDSDPWNTGEWNGGASIEEAVNEPNDANPQTRSQGDSQPWEDQEPRESAPAPMTDSWTRSDWPRRRGDGSSDGSSGDAATTADRRASDGSWGSWTSWGTWHPEWHGGWWSRWGQDGWHRGHWDDGGTPWPTSSTGTTFSNNAYEPTSTWTSSTHYAVAAWEKMTKLSLSQRALVLYQNLQGSAWVNAESLNVNDLASDRGVDYLRDWIRQHYLDIEVTQVGRSLSDLFRKLRRKPSQTFRDYTAEFNRLLARVTECGCKLPDVANAWLYVDRASLDETTEVSLLASVGNKYALKELQQAAIVLDRSMRKPWEKSGRNDGPPGRRYNSVNHAEDGVYDGEADTDEETMLEDHLEQDTGELYISYMTAKARYRDAAKSRGTTDYGYKGGAAKGFDPTAVKKAAEAKILLAKSKSHCAACGQKGHWHKDAVCPKRASGEKTQTVHVTNEIFELSTYSGGEGLYAILDSACSKTVVGTAWLERYLTAVRGRGFDTDFIYEKECFKFGAANRIYESTYATVVMMNLLGKWVAVKAAVIHGDLPLLLSRPALGRLGLVLDLGLSRASFRNLNPGELTLLETASGHPAVPIDHGTEGKPEISQLPKKWEPHGIEVLSSRVVYMTACAGDVGVGTPTGSSSCITSPKIFYDKKIDPAVRDMLVADVLN